MTRPAHGRRRCLFVLQVLVSCLLIFSLKTLSPGLEEEIVRLFVQIRDGDRVTAGVAMAIPFISLIFAAWKWSLCLDGFRFRDALLLHWAGDFISLAGPGSIGTDAYKIAVLKQPKRTVQLVLGIRLGGLLVAVVLLILVLAIDFVLGFALFFAGGLALNALVGARLKQRTPLLLPFLGVAGLNYMVLSFAYFVLLRALTSPTLELSLVLLVAESWATSLPLTYQGIGVREAVFSLLGQGADSGGMSLLPLGALLSITTILVRLAGVVPLLWQLKLGRAAENA